MAVTAKQHKIGKKTPRNAEQMVVRHAKNPKSGSWTRKNPITDSHSGIFTVSKTAVSSAVTTQKSSKIDRTRKGVTSRHMNRVVERSGFALSEWAKYLHLSERSIQRYFKDKKHFELPYAERIVEIEALFELGDSVFGDPEKFRLWLHRQSIALGGVTPADLLDTSEGVRLVSDELHRIEYGIFA